MKAAAGSTQSMTHFISCDTAWSLSTKHPARQHSHPPPLQKARPNPARTHAKGKFPKRHEETESSVHHPQNRLIINPFPRLYPPPTGVADLQTKIQR